MIICSTLPFLKDAKEIFTLFVMFNNSLIGHEDHQTPLVLWFCGLDSAQRSISISITHFDPVTIKTLNLLLIHSHFARTVHRQRASKITYRIVVFFNVFFLSCFVFVFILFYYLSIFIQKPLPYRSGHMQTWTTYRTTKTGRCHRACTPTVYADITHSTKSKTVKTGLKPRLPKMWNIKYANNEYYK